MFKFEIGDLVIVPTRTEAGTVVGRAEYVATENSYLVRYRSLEGHPSEAWCGESALVLP
jgi:hypothetical protein